MRRLRVGVVGLGKLSQAIHLPTLAAMTDVEVAAAAELDVGRLDAVAAQYGIAHAHADYRAMLAEVSLDAVFVVATPDATAGIAHDVLEAGLATFIEKPPGLSAEETARLAASAERAGAIAMVGVNRRFQPLVQEAKRLVEASGPIASILAEFHPYTIDHYRRAGFSEHVLRHFHAAQSIHAVDLLCYLGGEPVAVYGRAASVVSDHRDTFGAFVEFANGATGHVLCNYLSPTRLERAELHGRGAMAILEGADDAPGRHAYPFARAVVHRADGATTLTVTGDDAFDGGYRQEVRYFLDCVATGRRPVRPAADLTDAWRTMRVIDAVLAGHHGPLAHM